MINTNTPIFVEPWRQSSPEGCEAPQSCKAPQYCPSGYLDQREHSNSEAPEIEDPLIDFSKNRKKLLLIEDHCLNYRLTIKILLSADQIEDRCLTSRKPINFLFIEDQIVE